ncbi:hypothetical protein [Tritonibacter sp. AK171]|uniref:hypothetical protein n=1 Tax=Tritonibacter sp. AK171 TaxID=3048493 RepID=UPI0024C36236|nr:hypothetical protein [Tritonibacter sp. AK171]
MRLPILIALIGQLWSLPALAGAWLEQKGGGFTSTALRARASGQELSGYVAYGVSRRLTFGLDLHHSTGMKTKSAHALVFARLPLRQSDQGWQLAFELASGFGRDGAQWSGMRRLSLSAGRGLSWQGRDGWVNFDLTREWRRGGDLTAWKLDSALGIARKTGPSVILRTELYQPDGGEMIWKALPGLRWQLSPQREVLTGLEWRSFGAERLGLTVELWHRF